MELFSAKKSMAVNDSKVFNYNEIPLFHVVLNEKPRKKYAASFLACYDALRDAIGMAEGQLGDVFKAFGRCSGANEVPDDIGLVCNGLFEEYARVVNLSLRNPEKRFRLSDDLSKYCCYAHNVSLIMTICYVVHAFTCGHPIDIAILQSSFCHHSDRPPGGCFSIKKVSVGMRFL
jgi:hypothetical protein